MDLAERKIYLECTEKAGLLLFRRCGRYGRSEGKAGGIRNWIAGPDYQKCLNEYDVVFKSPGVVLEKPVQSYSSQILSQTELFFQCFRDQIIGITGTKGKARLRP